MFEVSKWRVFTPLLGWEKSRVVGVWRNIRNL